MKNIRNRKRGFTIAETLILVAIIGLLVAIAVPNFQRAKEQSRINLSTYSVIVGNDLAVGTSNKLGSTGIVENPIGPADDPITGSEIIDETIWGMRLTMRLVENEEMLRLTDPEKGFEAYRMATLRELTALVNTKPGRPKDRDIVALGSYKLSIPGKVSPRLYPVIGGDTWRFSRVGDWPSNSLFAIVAPK